LVQTQYDLAILRSNLAATFTGVRDEHHVNITRWQFTHPSSGSKELSSPRGQVWILSQLNTATSAAVATLLERRCVTSTHVLNPFFRAQRGVAPPRHGVADYN
jgi:hypothetical protein